MATGANSTPLGRLNVALTAQKATNPIGQSLLKPSYMQGGMKRELSEDEACSYFEANSNSSMWSAERASSMSASKRRRSRWGGDEKDKTFIPGMPTVLPSNLSKDQEKAYLLQLQIEEISRRLRTGDLGIPPNPEERSPSPEPIYNNEGKRLNTREYRTRKKLEDERHHYIQQMYDVNPDFKPPADYKPPIVRVSDKVMIPQEEHPDINFVGLLIGPRGNTLKAMEKETGAKIIIRGKGSVKEGKVGRKDGQPLPGEDEPLHAYVTANNPESVKKAVEKIKEIIRQGVEVPEGQNDLRRMQLRELALLNGTLRENDGPRCSNCGATSHKSWQCPDKPNVTNNVICTNCGGAGHIAKDCRERRPGVFPAGGNGVDKAKIDEEYMSLMAELGEGPPPPTKSGGSGMNLNHASSGNMMGQQGPPRAIMAPPGQSQQPSSMMNQNVMPPWGQSGPNNAPVSPPQSLPPWQPSQPNQGSPIGSQYSGVPSPMLLTQPPPPPPSGQPPTTMGMPWMQSPGVLIPGMHQGMNPPWGQQPPGVPPPPGPVPPPRPGGPVPPPGTAMPWQQGFMGVPPPPVQPPLPGGGPPPPPPPAQMAQSSAAASATVDLNALAQAGLPNLLAAPPPPPPS